MTARIGTQLARITGPLIVVVLLMWILTIASIDIVSATRGYVGGEGLWSKARTAATGHLLDFSRSGDRAHLERFHAALVVPLGDRQARLELSKADPDAGRVRQGFLLGGNHADDIDALARLFRRFGTLPPMRDAVAVWAHGDELIDELIDAAARLERALATASRDHHAIAAIVADVQRLDQRLGVLEKEFSATLGAAARSVTRALQLVLTVSALIFIVAGGMLSLRLLRRSQAVESALRSAEARAFTQQERSHVTLQSIGEAVIAAGCDGSIDFVNATAEKLTGWSTAQAHGMPLGSVVRFSDAQTGARITQAIGSVLAGASRLNFAESAVLLKQDDTTVPVDGTVTPIRDPDGEVTGIVLVMRDVTQERALTDQLQHQASHDALTGLINRREFEERLWRAIRNRVMHGTQQSMLYFDLDQFKVVNDTCGHPAGDELIRQVARLVKQRLRSGDTLARLGGDEFGVLLENCPVQSAVKVAESIRDWIGALRFSWNGRTFSIGASIGVVSLDDAPPSVAEVMSAADHACYIAKDSGRGRVRLYRGDDHDMQARHGEMQWVTRIVDAIAEDRFELYAQPIRPIGSQPQLGTHYEILLRMLDESGGTVAPMAFIPAAERYGLMPKIDRWVISRAFDVLAELHRGIGAVPRCVLNLSGATIIDPALIDFIAERFEVTGLPAQRIGFEVTETAAISNLSAAGDALDRLRALGCTVSLDDFGSGMSSFTYLRRLPVDFVKIDGHFVRNIASDATDRAMVEAIHRIAKVMGIETIAEWVDSQGCVDELARIGVDYAQGFGIGRPQPLQRLVTDWRTAGALRARQRMPVASLSGGEPIDCAA